MSLEPKPGPAGKKSRRAFIQKIGTAAVASTVAATSSTAQQRPAPAGPGIANERDFRPEPGPLSKQPMPTIRLGKHDIGRLVLGINGIGTHYSDMLGRTFREWNTPAQLNLVLKHCEELGINLRIQTRDQVNKYNKEFGGHMLFSCNSYLDPLPDGGVKDPRETLKKIVATGPIAIHYSASGSDDMWRRGKAMFGKVRDWCKMVRDMGVLVAINGHIPEMFMEMDSQGWEVDYYMPAMYLFGRTHEEWEQLFKFNPDLAPLEVGQPPTEGDSEYYGGENAWGRGDPPKMLKFIKQTKKPCLAFKILASGNLMANAQPRLQQQIVEARFKYVFENIKSTDGVVCAMWNKYEDQYALNKEYVVKYGGSSIRA
jgi:hypothetical protein